MSWIDKLLNTTFEQKYPNWTVFSRLYTLDEVGARLQWCKQHLVMGQWDATVAFEREEDGSVRPQKKHFGFQNPLDAILFKLRWEQC